MKTPVIFFHANCNDGSAAATVFYSKFGDEATYIPVVHGEKCDIEICKDRTVYFVDFVFPNETMKEIKNVCAKLVVLDHHKTAYKRLEGIEYEGVLDMERSGAMLAFNYLYPEHVFEEFKADYSMDAVTILELVQDRDLWTGRYGCFTNYIYNYLCTLEPFAHDNRDYWLEQLFYRNCQGELQLYEVADFRVRAYKPLEKGQAIEQYKDILIMRAVERAHVVEFLGYQVLATNETANFSEVAGALAANSLFGVAYFINKEGEHMYSLRSKGFDVASLAEKAGGGGHKMAAGCKSKEPLHKLVPVQTVR